MNSKKHRYEAHRIAELHPTLGDDFVATLLIPGFLQQELESHLEFHKFSLSILLRHLVYKYRKQLMENDLPVNHFHRKIYQAKGLNLQKRNLRPEPAVWELFSLMADFLGVSRCHLFSILLWMDVASEKRDEGVPTSRLEHHDIHFPRYVEFRKRLYPGKRPRMRREIHSEPDRAENIPHWFFPYPENLEWLRYVLALKAD